MPAYSVKMGISGTLSQQEAMDLLKNAGAEVIQTSDGLCLKTEKPIVELQKSNEKLSILSFHEIRKDQMDSETSQDVQAFLS